MRAIDTTSPGIRILACVNDIGEKNQHYTLRLDSGVNIVIPFQKGPIQANGVNGVTLESLLEIGADRLQVFQDGPFHCEENARALHHIKEALKALNERTANRVKRGVEGQHIA